VTNKALWATYALGYKDKDLLDKLSLTLETEHTNLQMADVVNACKAFAYFDYLNLPARDGLVKQAIRNSQEYDFKSLASICESLSLLNYENKTLLQIVRRMLLTFEDKGHLSHLVDNRQLSSPSISSYTKHLAKPGAGLAENYVKPVQCCQLMSAFASAGMFDLDVWNVLETLTIEQITSCPSSVLVRTFVAHCELSQNVVKWTDQPKRLQTHFKAYNEEFINIVVPELITRVKSGMLNLRGILEVIMHGKFAHLKRRDNIRTMHVLTIAGVETLANEALLLGSGDIRERLIVNYYSNSLIYCLNDDQVSNLKTAINDLITPAGLELNQLIETHCVFGVVG
jgi:hypothetical protein